MMHGVCMKTINKILLVIYIVALILIIGLAVYVNFINKDSELITNSRLLTLGAAFVVGIVKTMNRSSRRKSLSFYKQFYAENIKDSFEDNKANLTKLLKALRFYNEDKYQKALKLLDELLPECETPNERYSVYLFKALSFEDMNQDEKAVEVYEAMMTAGIADSVVFSNALSCYNRTGEHEKAYEAAHRAIRADSNNYNAYNNLAYLYFADANYEEAAANAKKCLELKSNMLGSITLLYLIYKLEGNDAEAEIYEKLAVANGRSKKELRETLEYYMED